MRDISFFFNLKGIVFIFESINRVKQFGENNDCVLDYMEEKEKKVDKIDLSTRIILKNGPQDFLKESRDFWLLDSEIIFCWCPSLYHSSHVLGKEEKNPPSLLIYNLLYKK